MGVWGKSGDGPSRGYSGNLQRYENVLLVIIRVNFQLTIVNWKLTIKSDSERRQSAAMKPAMSGVWRVFDAGSS